MSNKITGYKNHRTTSVIDRRGEIGLKDSKIIQRNYQIPQEFKMYYCDNQGETKLKKLKVSVST